jgi:hypothetical protein
LSRLTKFASGPLVFAVEGFVHVNVLHDTRTVFATREISKVPKPLCWDRYLIVMLLVCLMWSIAGCPHAVNSQLFTLISQLFTLISTLP